MAYETVPLSAHAERRTQDRSIPEIGHLLLREYGARRPAGGGTESIYWDKRSWKEVERVCGVWPLKKMDQLRRLYMIISADGVARTVAYRK
jgi:hypothetical protein